MIRIMKLHMIWLLCVEIIQMIHSGCFYLPHPIPKRKREHCFRSIGGQEVLKSSTSTHYLCIGFCRDFVIDSAPSLAEEG
ncbi:hypothetical protein VIGAN_10167500 [Vigna angularis var. angularis]|uniref:Secreted protein n=1 Tax=Vigna angularis var. angularis TaxID=157739 RepID=A0A0S3T501_PHAAN|nr:hypothetical protein VIGAN_10167500 [Vigna angularis var. angularis]